MSMAENLQAISWRSSNSMNAVDEALRNLERGLFCDCPHHDAPTASKNTWLWGVLSELERQQFSGAVEVDFRKGKVLMFCKIKEGVR